ncbi:MAG: cytotoxic translational repressor of toxin-antitoxin stability system [Acidimicrobiales bacterium]
MVEWIRRVTWPAPSREHHVAFCSGEGWEVVRKADGKSVKHHITYELLLPDGRILRTRISRPPDKTNYGEKMWAHILRDQLNVDASTFWACVLDGVKPDRGQSGPVGETLPAELVYLLRRHLRMSDAEIADMSRHAAIERMSRFWEQRQGS